MSRQGVDSALIRSAYLDACELELIAPKPGNVSVYSEGHGMTVEDFRSSARVSAGPLADPECRLGEKVFRAVDATWDSVGCNTNLGIVLLCAPLAQAAGIDSEYDLRGRLRQVLNSTTVEDAVGVYRAIRRAQPAGIGASDEQDVAAEPSVTLVEAMRIAAGRDRIAHQYISTFSDVFEFAKNRYHTAAGQWGDRKWAAVSVFTGLLRQFPDSHIERKHGNRFTRMVNSRIALLDEELSDSSHPELLLARLQEVDAEFKNAGINPGTTADLTVATVFAVNLETLLNGIPTTGGFSG